MPKERGIVRTLLVMLSCCGVLCLLQCAEKSRREIERPLDAARLIADRINDTQTQAQVLAAVGVKYAELGDYKRSLDALDSIDKGGFFSNEPASGYPPAWYQTNAWSEVALLLAQGKQQLRAQELLARALQKAKTIQNPHTQADALCQVVRNTAKAGEVDQAIEIARGITDTFFQPMALVEIADGLQGRQKFDRLLNTVDSISSPYSKTRTLILLAEQVIQRKQTDQAVGLLDRAYETTLQLKESSTDSDFLAKLAFQYALAGKKDRAQEIFALSLSKAESIRDRPGKSMEMSQLAILSAQAGDFKMASGIAGRMEPGDDQDRALIEVARSLAQAGRQAEARSITRQIQAQGRKDAAIAEIVAVHTERRQFHPAQQLAATIDNEFERSKALQQIAFEYGETRESRQALKIALGIPDARTQFYTLQKIALSMNRAGRSELALETAQMIKDSSYRARTLVSIAGQHVEAGASIKAAEIIDLALKEIALIQDQSDRADLLAEVSIPWMRANIESNAERKLILNKLAESK